MRMDIFATRLGPLRPAPQDGPGWMFAAGELAMPVRDLLLWDIAMMNESLLQPASYKEMFTGVKLKDGEDTHYGLGVEISTRHGHMVISHSGEVSGFTSENMVLPQDKVAIAVFTNQEAVGAAGDDRRQNRRHADWPAVRTNPSKARNRRGRFSSDCSNGKIDRSLFTENCNAYFDAQALGDFESSLKPLGRRLNFARRQKSRAAA